MRHRYTRIVATVTLAAAGTFLGACGDSTTGTDDAPIFVVQVHQESFRIKLTDPQRIAQARRILRGEESQKIVSGRLVRGDGGFNTGYRWHLDPATVEFVEAAIELCDGVPSFVEKELDYWIDVVKSFCPWGSRIVREE